MKLTRFAILAALAALALLPMQARAQQVKAVAAATYTFVNSDCTPNGNLLLNFSNGATAVAATLPQAGGSTNGFASCIIALQNSGTASVTITPSGSVINGLTTFVLGAGNSAVVFSTASGGTTGGYIAMSGNPAGAGSFANETPRNLLDNGDFAVQQRGTGTQTCGIAGSQNAVTTYSADRWACQGNVTSATGRSAAVTTSLPTGHNGGMQVWRNSAALTQPICTIQEVLSNKTVPAAGQPITLSFWAEDLGGLVTDNGGVINAYVLYGTGTDQGLQSWTASPAITPAWTGINSTLTKAFTLTTSWVRYSFQTALPSAATEMAVEVCFTPTATGAGATDGFALSGAQLETAAAPTSFEFRGYQDELSAAQFFYWQIIDPTASTMLPGACTETTANTSATCVINAPRPMRATPLAFVSNSTSFGITKTDGTADTCSTFAVVASGTTTSAGRFLCTQADTLAVGIARLPIGAAVASAFLALSADF